MKINSLLQDSRKNHNLFFDRCVERTIKNREEMIKVLRLIQTAMDCLLEIKWSDFKRDNQFKQTISESLGEMNNLVATIILSQEDTIISIEESKEKEGIYE